MATVACSYEVRQWRGYVRLELPLTNGLEISETQFAPDGLPVVLVGVQLSNSSPSAASFTLAIQAESELIPAYPWSGTTPTSESLHLPDQVSFDSTLGALQFFNLHNLRLAAWHGTRLSARPWTRRIDRQVSNHLEPAFPRTPLNITALLGL